MCVTYLQSTVVSTEMWHAFDLMVIAVAAGLVSA